MNLYFPTLKEKQELEDHAKRMGISPSSLVRLSLRKFYERMKHDDDVKVGQ